MTQYLEDFKVSVSDRLTALETEIGPVVTPPPFSDILNPFPADSTEYVPQKQFWIITLLTLYSAVSHGFPLAASFCNNVNTVEEKEKS